MAVLATPNRYGKSGASRCRPTGMIPGVNGRTAGAAGLVILVAACSSSRETVGTRTGSAQFTVHVELASQVKSSAPTTVGIVTWSTTAPGITSAEIDFGLDTTYGMVAPVDL